MCKFEKTTMQNWQAEHTYILVRAGAKWPNCWKFSALLRAFIFHLLTIFVGADADSVLLIKGSPCHFPDSGCLWACVRNLFACWGQLCAQGFAGFMPLTHVQLHFLIMCVLHFKFCISNPPLTTETHLKERVWFLSLYFRIYQVPSHARCNINFKHLKWITFKAVWCGGKVIPLIFWTILRFVLNCEILKILIQQKQLTFWKDGIQFQPALRTISTIHSTCLMA